MTFRIDPEARADVREHKRRRQTLDTRRRFTAEVRSCFDDVRRRPIAFPIHPDGDGDARVALLPGFPHLVLFRTDGADTTILAVLHAHSGPETVAAALARC